MWYTIMCPDCGKKFTYFTEHDEYEAIRQLYTILEKHEIQYSHRDAALERKELDVEYWIRNNLVKSIEKDQAAYEY